MNIVLAGNPNSGKTTLFNLLTGKNEKVGNRTGVTVDSKNGKLKSVYNNSERDITVTDLPGAYSFSPFTSDEAITRDSIINSSPDVIVNVVDATNISRSLFFTTQLCELNIPLIVVLNKSDINKKQHTQIDTEKLTKMLGCNVISTSLTQKSGISELISLILNIEKQTLPHRKSFDTDEERFDFIRSVVLSAEKRSESVVNKTDTLDKILTDKWIGIPLFAIVMLLVFQISQSWLGAWIAEGYEFENGTSIPGLVTLLEQLQEWLGSLLDGASPILYSLLIDGVVGGVIAVVGFLPLVAVMYFLIALLEDCGYMSRVAVLLDPIFKKVGLSGRSVIPFVITIGCAVPGIMASRTIQNERERRTTAMLAPFMPCGAKIPVISLFAGIFFDNAGWVSGIVYLLGIILIFTGAYIVNKIAGYNKSNSYFVIELPDYKTPSILTAVKTMLSRSKAYIVKATTVILICNTAIQVMQSFDFTLSVAESPDSSILATVALPFSYILYPIVGVLSWQLAAAAVTGFIAKENVVGTLAVCFAGLENFIDTNELALIEGSGAEAAQIFAISKAAALAYLMFNLYTPPCFAAIGAMNSEIKDKKWLMAGIGLQLGVGFSVGYLVYTVGTLITAPAYLDIVPAVCGFVIVVLFATFVIYLTNKSKTKSKTEFSLSR